jgi:hydrogenase maturation protein HypF
MLDPADRRHLYPFTNCTNCGPRYSILEALPYDRPNTTMARFQMCEACRSEYENPLNRRFHAQPIACPVCGPHLELWDPAGALIAAHHAALLGAAAAIKEGAVVAVKGLGGFHLIVHAGIQDAVMRLRERKHREEKPFAVMAPDITAVRALCTVDLLEERLLSSPEAPIVLLRRMTGERERSDCPPLCPSVAPGNPFLGVMLPYTPLHHLLMRELGFPVVATSGNISDEPICTDEQEALKRLGTIADLFLVHNRPIRRHVDDSVARVMLERELILRRARGYAPLPISVSFSLPDLLAVGPHLKNTVAVARDRNIFISQHIGDLETQESYEAFQHEIRSLGDLFGIKPVGVVSDLHPDYLSTKYAKGLGIPVTGIQHHFAHVAGCMAENGLDGTVLGVSWDGTGFGVDGTIWGGEFLLTGSGGYERVATLRRFMLPGGEAAVKEPRRAALGVLYEMFGEDLFGVDRLLPPGTYEANELVLLQQVLRKRINTPATSSAGRLFDAVASLIGVRHRCSFEGQAAMELEFLTLGVDTEESYEFRIVEAGSEHTASRAAVPPSPGRNPHPVAGLPHSPVSIDWAPMIRQILEDVRHAVPSPLIAARFHNTLGEIVAAVATRINVERVVLTGGCFQNRTLTERTVHGLRAKGFSPYWHQRVPPNDGGIALGQLSAVSLLSVHR